MSDVVTEAGATYTLRAAPPGFPPVEATVTVPARVPVAGEVGDPRQTEVPPVDGGTGYTLIERDVTLSFRDPSGPGDRYALSVSGGPWSYDDTRPICSGPDPSTCRDSTITYRFPGSQFGYRTSDPVLLAAARTPPSNGFSFITFTDEAFEGADRSFSLTVSYARYEEEEEGSFSANYPDPKDVWLTAVDADTFGAYQVAWFGFPLGDDNPLQEPIDLPSNVQGGYGLLGAVTINAAPLDP